MQIASPEAKNRESLFNILVNGNIFQFLEKQLRLLKRAIYHKKLKGKKQKQYAYFYYQKLFVDTVQQASDQQ